jgi:hypothetical protein
MNDKVDTMDGFLARRLGERLHEIEAEIAGELAAAGLDLDGPPEWDEYRHQRQNPPLGQIPQTPAHQEAVRRLKAGSPAHALAVSRWMREEVGEEVRK